MAYFHHSGQILEYQWNVLHIRLYQKFSRSSSMFFLCILRLEVQLSK
jgi:hypothetical protein